jgi:ribosomal protein S4E
MEENKVENVINIIKGMDKKDKLRLGICLTTSDWANILYNKTKMYEQFDTMLKEIDEEYRTTIINFSKYKLVMFTMAKIMEMEQVDRNKVALYLFNSVKN